MVSRSPTKRGARPVSGVVLIHGSSPLEWWRFTAPFLADRFRLAAIDLSGNGNSGWRERYTGKGLRTSQSRCAAQLGEPIVVGPVSAALWRWKPVTTSARTGWYLFMDFTVAPPRNP